jgi:hypothetical protein
MSSPVARGGFAQPQDKRGETAIRIPKGAEAVANCPSGLYLGDTAKARRSEASLRDAIPFQEVMTRSRDVR